MNPSTPATPAHIPPTNRSPIRAIATLLMSFMVAMELVGLILGPGFSLWINEAHAQGAKPLTSVGSFTATLTGTDAGAPTGTRVADIIPTAMRGVVGSDCRVTVWNSSAIPVYVGGKNVTKDAWMAKICTDTAVCKSSGATFKANAGAIFVLTGLTIDGGPTGINYTVAGGCA
jgi:hypothetical protein